MADHFTHIDTQKVATFIQQAKVIYQNLDELKTEITTEGDDVPSFWKATVSDNYSKDFETLKKNLTDFLNNNKNFIDSLGGVSNTYDQEENSMLDQVNAFDPNNERPQESYYSTF